MAEPQTPETAGMEHTPESRAPALGEVLQTARAAKKLTQQDVSNSLRYSVKQINALENGEYHLLPDAMITRGFIRNYAKLLDIDPEPLLAAYRQSVSSDADRIIVVKSSMRPVELTNESRPWVKYVLVSVVALLCVLAGLFYLTYRPDSSTPAVQPISQSFQAPSSATSEALPEIALPAAQRLADSKTAEMPASTTEHAAPAAQVADQRAVDPLAAGSAVINPAVTNSAEPVQIDFKSSVSPAAQIASVPAIPGATKPVEKSADKTITLAFTAETWVNATEKSGKVVYEKMSYSGEKQTLNVHLPITLVIGNASGTRLFLDGKAVELAPYTKSNVARITLE